MILMGKEQENDDENYDYGEGEDCQKGYGNGEDNKRDLDH